MVLIRPKFIRNHAVFHFLCLQHSQLSTKPIVAHIEWTVAVPFLFQTVWNVHRPFVYVRFTRNCVLCADCTAHSAQFFAHGQFVIFMRDFFKADSFSPSRSYHFHLATLCFPWEDENKMVFFLNKLKTVFFCCCLLFKFLCWNVFGIYWKYEIVYKKMNTGIILITLISSNCSKCHLIMNFEWNTFVLRKLMTNLDLDWNMKCENWKGDNLCTENEKKNIKLKLK